MKASNVEDLISLLESFDGEQPLSIGNKNGKTCLFVHDIIPVSRHVDCIYIQNAHL